MIFLTQTDLNRLLKPELLLQITGGDATLLDEAERAALAEVRSYLDGLYDTDVIFGQAGILRHAMVVQAVADTLLYHLFARVNPHSIPDLRQQRYRQATDWVRAVVNGERSADLPARIRNAEQPETDIRYGGLPKEDLSAF